MTLNMNQFAQLPTQGEMDLEGFGSNVISAQVSHSQATALVAGQAVKVENSAGGVPKLLALASNADITAGFIPYNLKDISYPADARCEMALNGSVMFMTAGGAIARWGNVEVVYTTNKVIAAAGVNPVTGFAIDKAAADGDLIRVYIVSAQETGSGTIASISGLQAALNALNAPVLPYEAKTPITTVGSGVLTAAGIVGKLIQRTGPVAAYSDATDSAVAIVAALNTYVAGSSFEVKIKNGTAYPQTITAGSGVTLTGNVVIPAFSAGKYLVTITSGVAVAIDHVEHAPLSTDQQEISTNLTIVGSGTITGAGIAGGVTNRTGSTSAFTDTTDTATAILAGVPNGHVGQAFEYTYFNNTGFPATLAAGSGVTLTGADLSYIPAGTWARYLVTLTATGTPAVSMQGIATGRVGAQPAAQFATGTTTTTFTAGQLTGADFTVYTNTGATPGSIATRTATQMIADLGNAYIGQTWILRIVNGQGTGTLTVTAGVDVTLTGTATIAVNSWRDFHCTVTSIALHTITMQNIGTGTFS